MNQSDTVGNNNILDLTGLLYATEIVPSAAPRKFSEQIVLVSGGASTAAYFYDTAARAWKKVALT